MELNQDLFNRGTARGFFWCCVVFAAAVVGMLLSSILVVPELFFQVLLDVERTPSNLPLGLIWGVWEGAMRLAGAGAMFFCLYIVWLLFCEVLPRVLAFIKAHQY